METNINSWFHHQPLQQSSFTNSLSSPFNMGQLNNISPYMSPCANISSPNRTFTEIAFSKVPNHSHGWFYGLPHYKQVFNDVNNTLSHEKSPYFSRENRKETVTANLGSSLAQKRFLVFDQSGDQTTLFYSPGTGPPVKLTSGLSNVKNNGNIDKIVQTNKYQHQDANNEIQRFDTESELHEDTEEINALLYSDDDYYEDEEEASTGHSPSTMTDFDRERCNEREEKEVASNFGPNKRIKLSKGGVDLSPLTDCAISGDPKYCSECENDAESSCGGGENLDLGKKRKMKDQIRETVSLLQSIIPEENGNDTDVIIILDEAINYLKSLKVKAQALGICKI